mmetsp:Transcript_12922/g.58310  ORF Transcript_12922/g.58310 Transcript_12922/m.58310 type:complete len:266 (-) Transcript_12922:20-817(-)
MDPQRRRERGGGVRRVHRAAGGGAAPRVARRRQRRGVLTRRRRPAPRALRRVLRDSRRRDLGGLLLAGELAGCRPRTPGGREGRERCLLLLLLRSGFAARGVRGVGAPILGAGGGRSGRAKLRVPRRRRIARRLRHSPRAGDAGGARRARPGGTMGAPVARADVHAAAVRGRRRRRVGVSARRRARLAVRKLDQFRVGEEGRVVPERRRRRAARERDQGGGESVGEDRARGQSERVPRGRGGRRVDGQVRLRRFSGRGGREPSRV